MCDVDQDALAELKGRVAALKKNSLDRMTIYPTIAQAARVVANKSNPDVRLQNMLRTQKYTFPKTFKEACSLFEGLLEKIVDKPDEAPSCVNAIFDLAKKLCKEDEEADQAPSVISQGTGSTGPGSFSFNPTGDPQD